MTYTLSVEAEESDWFIVLHPLLIKMGEGNGIRTE